MDHAPPRSPSGDSTSAETFRIDDLDYVLPDELIAQHPPARREDARLLVVNRNTGDLLDRSILDLPALLSPGDLLVLNDSRVLPARFLTKRQTGGRLPGLFVEEEAPGRWRVMLQGGGRLREAEVLQFVSAVTPSPSMRLLARLGEGHWRVELDVTDPPEITLARVGGTPLPPYIRRSTEPDEQDAMDRSRYQTVYARHPGSIAAPTAGLHFTEALLSELNNRAIDSVCVTLHVGVGTFKPLTTSRIEQHQMHSERYEISADVLRAIQACRTRGGRVVAVGTTSARVLETVADSMEQALKSDDVIDLHGSTALFIHPPYRFKAVDVLLTNFHLPRSTLLALVMTLAGVELTRRAYRHAIQNAYRFFSYGDAMLIL
ncbi:MAG: tRNA preQ1(34) S-adenosylmethionine ribosyltransferase-isomerase QueA [Phycisphaerae bacterium]|nr:tRNA preQ1(34) S-adenosylmethionine ribosyltransferase-isomerase QueA [Phycisphaerae bacterium]